MQNSSSDTFPDIIAAGLCRRPSGLCRFQTPLGNTVQAVRNGLNIECLGILEHLWLNQGRQRFAPALLCRPPARCRLRPGSLFTHGGLTSCCCPWNCWPSTAHLSSSSSLVRPFPPKPALAPPFRRVPRLTTKVLLRKVLSSGLHLSRSAFAGGVHSLIKGSAPNVPPANLSIAACMDCAM